MSQDLFSHVRLASHVNLVDHYHGDDVVFVSVL